MAFVQVLIITFFFFMSHDFFVGNCAFKQTALDRSTLFQESGPSPSPGSVLLLTTHCQLCVRACGCILFLLVPCAFAAFYTACHIHNVQRRKDAGVTFYVMNVLRDLNVSVNHTCHFHLVK